MPGVFAFADQVIGNPQTSLFAAFGSFAVLVLVEFGGRWRTRLVAYLALAAVGVVLIALGTLCSRDAWLAAGATGVVGFVTSSAAPSTVTSRRPPPERSSSLSCPLTFRRRIWRSRTASSGSRSQPAWGRRRRCSSGRLAGGRNSAVRLPQASPSLAVERRAAGRLPARPP